MRCGCSALRFSGGYKHFIRGGGGIVGGDVRKAVESIKVWNAVAHHKLI